MSDIFISYAREDRAKAKILFETLTNQGFSVWWDPEIPPGEEFRQVITRALDDAKCVIVLWSKVSVGSRWVREEANRGDRRGILIPVLIENVEMPLGFGEIQAVRLVDWKGSPSYAGFGQLVEAMSKILHRPPPPPPPHPWLKIILGLVTIVSVTLILMYLLWPTHLIFTPDENNPFVDGNEISFRFRQSRRWFRGEIAMGVLVDTNDDAKILGLKVRVGQKPWPGDPNDIESSRKRAGLAYEPGYWNDNDHVLTVTFSKLPVRMWIYSTHLEQDIEWPSNKSTQ